MTADSVTSDTLGLGLGETSAVEAWTEKISRPTDHYFDHPKDDLL